MTTKNIPRTEQKLRAAAEGVERVTLSFYKYFSISSPHEFAVFLRARLEELNCYGRIYIAKEGINAQMNVPKTLFGQFDAFMKSYPDLRGIPLKIAVEEGQAPSFYKLTIKVKDKIVADGLDDDSFDPSDTGAYLTAKEFNDYIGNEDAVVVDMRNAYESEVGHFESAITPQVDTFKEELAIAPELLRIHKNKKIALYCTGGIRCEKASAWLKHNGFTDVRHLRGGIIDYKHQVKREGLPNKFKGKNFVFDERLGERVGEEVIATCHLCQKEKSDDYHHCRFQVCHTLFLGCTKCIEKKGGYCGYVCRALDQLPQDIKKLYARYYNKLKRPKPFKKKRLRR